MISEREKLVLEAIIDYYLSQGDAVGSRTLVKRYFLGLSPATIRNVMADLEEMGYISKVHSSSGRAPTTQGYKYYIDVLLEVKKLSENEIERVSLEYEQKTRELELILSKTSSLLSRMSHYAGVALEPDIKRECLKKIELVYVNSYTLLGIIVTDNGSVKTKKLSLDKPVEEDRIKALVEILNREFSGRTISNICLESIEKAINKTVEGHLLSNIFSEIDSSFYIEGNQNLLSEIIRQNSGSAPLTFKFLEAKEDIKKLLETFVDHKPKGDINILLGEDLNIEELKDLSFIFSTYDVGKSKGLIGIIGPKRMEYSKVAGLVSHVAREVTKFTKYLRKIE